MRTPAVLMTTDSPGIRSGSPAGFSSVFTSGRASIMVMVSDGFGFSSSVSITMSLVISGLASPVSSAGTASGLSPMIFLMLSVHASCSPSWNAGSQGKVQIISFCPAGVEKTIFTAGSLSCRCVGCAARIAVVLNSREVGPSIMSRSFVSVAKYCWFLTRIGEA